MQGWEETVDAAIAHLLKTCLSKSSKEQALNLSSQLNIPKDTSRLKKHITLLCDRLAKGGRLCVSTDAAAPQAMAMPGKNPVTLPQDSALPIIEMCLQLYLGLNFVLK